MSYVIVGLGNPGAKYAFTRHNIGFMVVDALSGSRPWHEESLGSPAVRYLETTIRLGGSTTHVIKPLTYMNDSGKAARLVIQRLSLPPSRVIAVVDEYNFPVGKVHLRPRGSDGGHNGLTSMIEELGTDEFWRLRCGIDRKFGPGELVDYVLSDFGADEVAARDAMITKAVEALKSIISLGPERAMQLVNRDA